LVTPEGAAQEGEFLGLVDGEDGAVAVGAVGGVAGRDEGYAAEVERPCAAVEAEGDGGIGGGVAEGVEVDAGGYLEEFGGEVVFALGEVPGCELGAVDGGALRGVDCCTVRHGGVVDGSFQVVVVDCEPRSAIGQSWGRYTTGNSRRNRHRRGGVAEAGLVALLEEAVVESPELSIAEEIMIMELSGKASAFFLKSLVAMAAVAVELLSASTVVQT